MASDLLSYPSFGEQRHHLTLARCKRLKPSLQSGQFLGLRAIQLIVLDAVSNRIEQLLVPKRLGQKFYSAGFYGANLTLECRHGR